MYKDNQRCYYEISVEHVIIISYKVKKFTRSNILDQKEIWDLKPHKIFFVWKLLGEKNFQFKLPGSNLNLNVDVFIKTAFLLSDSMAHDLLKNAKEGFFIAH